jgi:hypothetical protein
MKTNQCPRCLRYRGDAACDAFPKGIPEKILTGLVDHSKPVSGDKGKQFLPADNIMGKSLGMVVGVNAIVQKDAVAYSRVKSALKKVGYKDSDFEEGGPLYGWSVNELIDLARAK